MRDKALQERPWPMIFADDTVICSESGKQVEEKLERWRRKGHGFCAKNIYVSVNERDPS